MQSKSPHPPFSKGGQGGDLVLLQLQWLLDAVARTSSLVRGRGGSLPRNHGQTSLSVPPVTRNFFSVTTACCFLMPSSAAILQPRASNCGGTDKFTCPWYRRLYPSRSRTNKFVRATRLPMVRSWILDAVLGGTDKFTYPWYRRLYPSRSRTNRVCPCHRCPCHLSLVTRNLSLVTCHCRPLNTGQYLE